MDLCRQLFPVGEGSHATPSEVSVTWFGYPEAVKHVAMTPRIAPNGPILDADDYRRRFPDGRIGSDPSQANIEAGEKIVTAAVKAAKAGSIEFRAEKSGIVHAGVGKASFSEDAIAANVKALVTAITRAKPAGAKGTFIKKVSISSTMGPGVKLDPASAINS